MAELLLASRSSCVHRGLHGTVSGPTPCVFDQVRYSEHLTFGGSFWATCPADAAPWLLPPPTIVLNLKPFNLGLCLLGSILVGGYCNFVITYSP